MVINKRWNIGESEYLLTQNLNQNKIKVHINSYVYNNVDSATLFHAYRDIFNDLGNFRLSTIDGLIYITIDKSSYEFDVNMFDYDFNAVNRNDGMLIKEMKCTNLYECFDSILCLLEEE